MPAHIFPALLSNSDDPAWWEKQFGCMSTLFHIFEHHPRLFRRRASLASASSNSNINSSNAAREAAASHDAATLKTSRKSSRIQCNSGAGSKGASGTAARAAGKTGAKPWNSSTSTKTSSSGTKATLPNSASILDSSRATAAIREPPARKSHYIHVSSNCSRSQAQLAGAASQLGITASDMCLSDDHHDSFPAGLPKYECLSPARASFEVAQELLSPSNTSNDPLEELKESIQALAKLQQATQEFVDSVEAQRQLSSLSTCSSCRQTAHNAPSTEQSFTSYGPDRGEGARTSSFDYTEAVRISQKLQETRGRLSLDGREIPKSVLRLREALRSRLGSRLETDDHSLELDHPPVHTYSNQLGSKQASSAGHDLKQDKKRGFRPVSNVIARLMGLEDLPSQKETALSKLHRSSSSRSTTVDIKRLHLTQQRSLKEVLSCEPAADEEEKLVSIKHVVQAESKGNKEAPSYTLGYITSDQKKRCSSESAATFTKDMYSNAISSYEGIGDDQQLECTHEKHAVDIKPIRTSCTRQQPSSMTTPVAQHRHHQKIAYDSEVQKEVERRLRHLGSLETSHGKSLQEIIQTMHAKGLLNSGRTHKKKTAKLVARERDAHKLHSPTGYVDKHTYFTELHPVKALFDAGVGRDILQDKWHLSFKVRGEEASGCKGSPSSLSGIGGEAIVVMKPRNVQGGISGFSSSNVSSKLEGVGRGTTVGGGSQYHGTSKHLMEDARAGGYTSSGRSNNIKVRGQQYDAGDRLLRARADSHSSGVHIEGIYRSLSAAQLAAAAMAKDRHDQNHQHRCDGMDTGRFAASVSPVKKRWNDATIRKQGTVGEARRSCSSSTGSLYCQGGVESGYGVCAAAAENERQGHIGDTARGRAKSRCSGNGSWQADHGAAGKGKSAKAIANAREGRPVSRSSGSSTLSLRKKRLLLLDSCSGSAGTRPSTNGMALGSGSSAASARTGQDHCSSSASCDHEKYGGHKHVDGRKDAPPEEEEEEAAADGYRHRLQGCHLLDVPVAAAAVSGRPSPPGARPPCSQAAREPSIYRKNRSTRHDSSTDTSAPFPPDHPPSSSPVSVLDSRALDASDGETHSVTGCCTLSVDHDEAEWTAAMNDPTLGWQVQYVERVLRAAGLNIRGGTSDNMIPARWLASRRAIPAAVFLDVEQAQPAVTPGGALLDRKLLFAFVEEVTAGELTAQANRQYMIITPPRAHCTHRQLLRAVRRSLRRGLTAPAVTPPSKPDVASAARSRRPDISITLPDPTVEPVAVELQNSILDDLLRDLLSEFM